MSYENEIHQFVLTRQTSEFAEWECPVCQRQVRLGGEFGLKIVNPGDQSVNHGSVSTSPGMKLGDASIKPSPSFH